VSPRLNRHRHRIRDLRLRVRHDQDTVLIAMHSTERSWEATELLVRLLTAEGRGPNLLVRCPGTESERVRRMLVRSCEPPVYVCRLPGPLELPSERSGTLLLENASALGLAQQVCLHDWMSHGSGRMQVISVICEPLYPMVERGQFLEGLFYRLNVVSIEAKAR
jgi:hypothetical protein